MSLELAHGSIVLDEGCGAYWLPRGGPPAEAEPLRGRAPAERTPDQRCVRAPGDFTIWHLS